MHVNESLKVDFNVIMRLLADDGRILKEHRSSNITVDIGRMFLRDSLRSLSYPESSLEDPTPSGDGPDWDDVPVAYTRHLPRFIAVGTGGGTQDKSYPGPGAQTAITGIQGLERPIPVKYSAAGFKGEATWNWLWCKQVEPQLDGSYEVPDSFTVRFRAVFGKDDLSFAGQVGSYGTMVPVSEALLLTSSFHPYEKPPSALATYEVQDVNGAVTHSFTGFNGDVEGALAYDIGEVIPKTPRTRLEVIWEMRS